MKKPISPQNIIAQVFAYRTGFKSHSLFATLGKQQLFKWEKEKE
jgi:hypothetical protein